MNITKKIKYTEAECIIFDAQTNETNECTINLLGNFTRDQFSKKIRKQYPDVIVLTVSCKEEKYTMPVEMFMEMGTQVIENEEKEK